MRYISTRGRAPALEFDDALLAGLADDGGLYVPESWPVFTADDLRAMRGLPYHEIAVRVIAPFVGGRIGDDDLARVAAEVYGAFDHSAVAPLKQLDADLWLMELFHGPTLAFKDYAMQVLGRLFDLVLSRRGERVTIVGATSGDTGSAAIEAFRDRDAAEVFILYPHGRVSEVQRRQMTTVDAANVHAIAVEGTFDDCQDLLKAMFADAPFRDAVRLAAVNSINWGRIVTQIPYYVHAALALGGPDRAVAFAVPSGNFGNVYAGYAARACGLPIARFIVGSNVNDILTRFFASGEMTLRAVEPTISPSMDIQVSSNFERLLFDLYDRDGAALADLMTAFRATGRLEVGHNRWNRATDLFEGYRLDDAGTRQEIVRTLATTGELLDPHSAIGVAAARACRHSTSGQASGTSPPDASPSAPLGAPLGAPIVALATAHPAKFPDAVRDAVGVAPALPARLSDLLERQERMAVLPNDLATVQAYIRERVTLRGAA